MRAFRIETRRFGRDQDGAALVEFALVFPLMLLFFAVVAEMGRMLWTYQIALSGVREAGRYLARVAPIELCLTSGATLASYDTTLAGIVRNNLGGSSLFPSSVTIDSVAATHSCTSGSYRTSPVPVASVTATLTVTFPLASLFAAYGGLPGSFTTTITEQSRIFGQ